MLLSAIVFSRYCTSEQVRVVRIRNSKSVRVPKDRFLHTSGVNQQRIRTVHSRSPQFSIPWQIKSWTWHPPTLASERSLNERNRPAYSTRVHLDIVDGSIHKVVAPGEIVRLQIKYICVRTIYVSPFFAIRIRVWRNGNCNITKTRRGIDGVHQGCFKKPTSADEVGLEVQTAHETCNPKPGLTEVVGQ